MNFADILDKKPEEVERPKILPVGTYTWIIEKPPAFDTVGQGKFDTIDYTLKCTAPGEDVDQDELQDYGNYTNARTRLRFMFNTEDKESFIRTENNHKRFLQDHVKCWRDGESLKEAIANCVGQEVLGVLSHRPDPNDPEIVYAEVRKTAPVG